MKVYLKKTLLKEIMFIKKSALFKERIISYYEKKALEKENDTNQSDILQKSQFIKNLFLIKTLELMIEFSSVKLGKKIL